MNPVITLAIPHNGRMEFDPEGSEKLLGEFIKLPIPMPQHVMMWTGADGKPLVMWCDTSGRIRPADFATVWRGIEQFNADLEKRIPAAVMDSDRWH
jgi:hypothetical protein